MVLRLFDETLAVKVAGAFAMPAISTAQVSAPAFIAAATGRKVYQAFQLSGQQVHLTDLHLRPGGGWSAAASARSRPQPGQHRHAPGPDGCERQPGPSVVLVPVTILLIAPMDRLLGLEART